MLTRLASAIIAACAPTPAFAGDNTPSFANTAEAFEALYSEDLKEKEQGK